MLTSKALQQLGIWGDHFLRISSLVYVLVALRIVGFSLHSFASPTPISPNLPKTKYGRNSPERKISLLEIYKDDIATSNRFKTGYRLIARCQPEKGGKIEIGILNYCRLWEPRIRTKIQNEIEKSKSSKNVGRIANSLHRNARLGKTKKYHGLDTRGGRRVKIESDIPLKGFGVKSNEKSRLKSYRRLDFNIESRTWRSAND